MEYKYLECDYQPCRLYLGGDSEKCEYMKIFETKEESKEDVEATIINDAVSLGILPAQAVVKPPTAASKPEKDVLQDAVDEGVNEAIEEAIEEAEAQEAHIEEASLDIANAIKNDDEVSQAMDEIITASSGVKPMLEPGKPQLDVTVTPEIITEAEAQALGDNSIVTPVRPNKTRRLRSYRSAESDNSTLYLVVGGAVILLVVGGAYYALSSGKKKKKKK